MGKLYLDLLLSRGKTEQTTEQYTYVIITLPNHLVLPGYEPGVVLSILHKIFFRLPLYCFQKGNHGSRHHKTRLHNYLDP